MISASGENLDYSSESEVQEVRYYTLVVTEKQFEARLVIAYQ